MTQEQLVHQATPQTIVFLIDRAEAPAVLTASHEVAAAAKSVCQMMNVERVASFGAQHVYMIHDGVELGVLVHIDLVRNRAHVIEWTNGTDLGEKIEQYLNAIGYTAELHQVGFGTYLYSVLAGHCPIFDERAVVLACLSTADYDLCA